MKKLIILAFALIVSAMSFAQERDYTVMKGLSFGIGLPVECRDLPGMGLSANIGYDATWHVNGRIAMGLYLTAGAGFWGEFLKYASVDNCHMNFRLAAGLLMQIEDLQNQNRPWLVGVAPCTGFGLYDMDMVLPLEVRFGKFITDRWYIMGELTYHLSMANETACFEPAIRVGYNFGRKIK